MKLLNGTDLNKISGGETFVLVTSLYDIEGIPPVCINRFFNNTNSTLVGALDENLLSILSEGCKEFCAKVRSLEEYPILVTPYRD